LTDEQIISLFQNARKSDYEKIIQDANHLLAEWSSGNMNPRDPAGTEGVWRTNPQSIDHVSISG